MFSAKTQKYTTVFLGGCQEGCKAFFSCSYSVPLVEPLVWVDLLLSDLPLYTMFSSLVPFLLGQQLHQLLALWAAQALLYLTPSQKEIFWLHHGGRVFCSEVVMIDTTCSISGAITAEVSSPSLDYIQAWIESRSSWNRPNRVFLSFSDRRIAFAMH